MAAKDLKLKVTWNIPDTTQVLADAVSLKHQILGNIISNAIKFSFQGDDIELIISEESGMLQIVVRDHGMGMAVEQTKHLFDEKGKSRPGTSGEKGTGLECLWHIGLWKL